MRTKSLVLLACVAIKLTNVAPLHSQTKASPQRLTPNAMQTYINSLQVKDVAWRKIPWRTTLLEGLHESRAKKKPVILWIFIDRPVDDERC